MKLFYFSLITYLLFNCANAQSTGEFVADAPSDILINGNDLYFCEYNNGKISKIDITDSTPVKTEILTGLSRPSGMAINGNDLYFSEIGDDNGDPDDGKISKIDITDSSPIITEVLTGLSTPFSIAIQDQDLYFSESGDRSISKIDITTISPPPVLVSGLTSIPGGIILHNNDLYFCEYSSGKINKIDITDSSPVATEVITGLTTPRNLAFDGNDLYFCEYSSDKISKIDITEVSPTIIEINTIAGAGPSSLAIKNSTIYVSELDNNKISFSNLSTLNVHNSSMQQKVKVFPNPANTYIEVSGLNKRKDYIIYNTLGVEKNNGIISNNGKINIQNLANGMYLLKFDNKKPIKFIKE
ncbi:T9SS type A sorting domain-containing protein [Tamlana sp. 2201CG12-4]|uniref:T9SS type A sorting domain-containing protein n=1 Tax=Tamlana sp. 2201CG12-4 TaxID=3112582 RepID=UPI002DBEE6F0|nr:T9SS type A sorting domain-containing protein [Tamlana sp. 2201CG12-4]MEC3908781.1 T9SS type A sorting domain-containing protein [Tamlana sp. 2201CG12-4]